MLLSPILCPNSISLIFILFISVKFLLVKLISYKILRLTVNTELNSFMECFKHRLMSQFYMFFLSLVVTFIMQWRILWCFKILRCCLFIREYLILFKYSKWPSLWCASISKDKKISFFEHLQWCGSDISWWLGKLTALFLADLKLFFNLLFLIC